MIPGLGNLLDMPASKPFLTFDAWARKYGDLVGLKVGAANFVIINNPAIVHELCDKQGAIYSDRAESYILKNHVYYEQGHGVIFNPVIMPYDEYFRRWRKSYQSFFSNSGVKRLTPLLEAEGSHFAHTLIRAGVGQYKNALRTWSLAVPLVVTTGRRLEDYPPHFEDVFFQNKVSQLKIWQVRKSPGADHIADCNHLTTNSG